MVHEKTALIVYQELVELGHHRRGDSKALGGSCHDGLQCGFPVTTSDADSIGVDLPSSPNVGVDQRFFAAAVRRLISDGDELLGLHR